MLLFGLLAGLLEGAEVRAAILQQTQEGGRADGAAEVVVGADLAVEQVLGDIVGDHGLSEVVEDSAVLEAGKVTAGDPDAGEVLHLPLASHPQIGEGAAHDPLAESLPHPAGNALGQLSAEASPVCGRGGRRLLPRSLAGRGLGAVARLHGLQQPVGLLGRDPALLQHLQNPHALGIHALPPLGSLARPMLAGGWLAPELLELYGSILGGYLAGLQAVEDVLAARGLILSALSLGSDGRVAQGGKQRVYTAANRRVGQTEDLLHLTQDAPAAQEHVEQMALVRVEGAETAAALELASDLEPTAWAGQLGDLERLSAVGTASDAFMHNNPSLSE